MLVSLTMLVNKNHHLYVITQLLFINNQYIWLHVITYNPLLAQFYQ